MPNLFERMQIAYKKLKASVYFDKSQLSLRNKIVSFESEGDIESKLMCLANLLQIADNERWEEWKKQQLCTVRTLLYPKKIKNKVSSGEIIYNSLDTSVDIDKPQHYFDMAVEGHILGILWVLMIGLHLDKDMVENSFGNRIRKSITDDTEETLSFSPYLFEPYFEQYVTWRDQALEQAKKWLEAKKDVLILTLDFQNFFYSIDLTSKDFDSFLEIIERDENFFWIKRLNEFIYNVIEVYSSIFHDAFEKRNILPIGFFPSNILANWRLDVFDKAIINRWNPTYYGRYVDDIIIVDRVEKSNKLYRKANSGILSKTDIIRHYLINCGAIKDQECGAMPSRSLFLDPDSNDSHSRKDTKLERLFKKNDDLKIIYKINPELFVNGNSNIKIQNKKLNAFYFQAGATKALLDCFQADIGNNVSEFRLMPDASEEIGRYDYRKIYSLNRSDTINKLHGIKSISIDKFEISKFLGKQLRFSSLVVDDRENQLEHDILEIFDHSNLIEFYSTWEKLFQILITKSKFDTFVSIIDEIIMAISKVQYPHVKSDDLEFPYTGSYCNHKLGLIEVLFSAICRAASLSWGRQMQDALQKIEELINSKLSSDHDIDFSYANITKYRKHYYMTSMIDKYSIPMLVDFIKVNLPDSDLSDYRDFKFYSLSDITKISPSIPINQVIGFLLDNPYKYSPYMITPQDLSFSMIAIGLNYDSSFSNDSVHLGSRLMPDEIAQQTNKLYSTLNFNVPNDIKNKYTLKQVECRSFPSRHIHSEKSYRSNYATRIQGSKKAKLRIAIANVEIAEKDFVSVLTDTPNRSRNRYNDITKLVNEAIKEKVDLIVFPECYVPFEMILPLARNCAKNQIALITGVEHVIVSDKLYNMTAVILPYKQDQFCYSHISMHYKVHFSPEEKRIIQGYRCKCAEGDFYNLFCWNDIWFPIYSCFELASVIERAQFQSYADLIIAVEWNKDINYFGSIIDSLSRDLHCYCVQVNSSNYGDSRISQPAKTDIKDLLKTKGGINKTILVGEIDIDKLRNFQLKEYELQKEDESFKATPPLFDIEILKKKMKGKLWEYVVKDQSSKM